MEEESPPPREEGGAAWVPFAQGDKVWYQPCQEDIRHLAEIVRVLSDDKAMIHFADTSRRFDKTVDIRTLRRASSADAAAARSIPRPRQENVRADPLRNLDRVIFGGLEIDVWYFAPYPPAFLTTRILYVCDFCLKYFSHPDRYLKHMQKHRRPNWFFPPGREIYRDRELSVFEVYAREAKLYCQCLSLLSKLFMEDASLCYCIEGFVFYVCVEFDRNGLHFRGYFCRQINQVETTTLLSCIMVLPPFQRKGIGRMLIAMAYEIAKRMKVIGGPERPLSAFGKQAFMSYWKEVVVRTLIMYGEKIQSFDDFMRLTSMTRADLSAALRELEIKIRYKGQKKEITEFDMARVGAVYEERREGVQRGTFSPDLLAWLPQEIINVQI
jgi:histone acetyltransferase MYST1